MVKWEELGTDLTHLNLTLKLYDFEITLDELLAELHKAPEKKTFTDYTKYNYSRGIMLVPVRKILVNRRNTLKLVILDNGLFAFLNSHAKTENSIPHIYVPYGKQSNLYENISEGQYLFNSKYWSHWTTSVITDCQTQQQAEEFWKTYKEITSIFGEYGRANELDQCRTLEVKGILRLQELKEYLKRVEKARDLYLQLEAKEEELKKEALKKKIHLAKEGKVVKIEIEGLDEHKYYIEGEDLTIPLDKLIPFVYRHRYKIGKWIKEETLFRDFWLLLGRYEKPMKIAVDDVEPVEVKFTYTKNGQRASYLNGKRVAHEELYTALKEYFLDKKELKNLEEKQDKAEEIESLRRKREERLTTEGISGQVYDLEGWTTITLGFEKEGRTWNIVVGDLKLPLKGGVATIKRLKSVLDGTAHYVKSRNSTEELYIRLSKIIGEEDALKILNKAKEMSKLLRALEDRP